MDRIEAGRELLQRCNSVCPHTDADGLASGALALRARGEKASDAVLLDRGQTPWSLDPASLLRPAAILDWGARRFEGPALIVDHHAAPEGGAAEQIVITGYGREPETSTAAMMLDLVPAGPTWVAAVGAVGDLGDDAWVLPALEGVVKSHIKKLVPLINAPRRLPSGPLEEALAVLVENETSRDALQDERLQILTDAKEEWRGAFKAMMKVAPKVDDGVAVIRFRSPYQIHPLVAMAWARRLAPNLVLVANDDYIPGMVNFSVRGGDGDLRQRLKEALPDQQGEFAHGHDRATGGSLPPERFSDLLEGLGAGR